MRRMFLLVLLPLIVVPVAPAAAEPIRVVAVGPKGIAAEATLPVNLGVRQLGRFTDIDFTYCFGTSFNDCSGQGTVALLQGVDTPFFMAVVYREVVATGARTPVSFPVTLQSGQRLRVLFQWVTDRLDPVSDTVSLRATLPSGASEDFDARFSGSGVPSPVCTLGPDVLCLKQGRFTIRGHYLTPAAEAGEAQGVSLSSDTGYLWFFSQSNAEAMIKVLDGCSFNNRFWVFAGGLTNVRTLLTVTDTQQDAVKIYINPQGRPFQPIQDTSAFATCP